jgi:hypothetical protein
MNEQTNRNLTLIERIRDTCAELDPVPDDVLAAARGARPHNDPLANTHGGVSDA